MFDNGNLIRTQAKQAGVDNAFDIPIFTEAYLRPLFCARHRPLPLDGALRRPGRHRPASTTSVLEMFPDNKIVTNWIGLARQHMPFEGLPARIAWLGHGERTALALRGQRAGAQRASSPARWPSPATISTPAPWPTPTS